MNRGCPAYGDLDSEEDFIEDYEETPPISKKDWFKPANVSLARLDKVKPVATVYNLGLRDPRDLQTGRGKTAPVPVTADQLSDLQTEPPLSTVSYQKAAWGSQTSIPELLKQAAEAGTKPSRPSSAKTGSMTKPPAGRKPRPQSAKDPLCPPGKKKTGSAFGVKGHKYDPSERLGKYGAHPGGGCVGWAGPPAGLCEPSVDITTNSGHAANTEMRKFQVPVPPPPPNSSPEPQDENNCFENSQHYSPPSSPGLCLSLSLPSADVDATDEPDTGRLLAEADKYVKKQKKKGSRKIKYFKADDHRPGRIGEALKTSLSSCEQTSSHIAENSETHDEERTDAPVNGLTVEVTSQSNTFEEVTDKAEQEDSPGIGDHKENGAMSGDNMLNDLPIPELSLDLQAGLEQTDPKTGSENPLPPSNGFDLEYLGPAKQDPRNRSHPIFLMPEKKPSLHKESKLSAHGYKPQKDKHQTVSNEDKKESDDKEIKREPGEKGTAHQKGDIPSTMLRSGVHIREDCNVTVDITPRNLGRKVNMKSSRKNKLEQDLSDFEIRNGLSEKLMPAEMEKAKPAGAGYPRTTEQSPNQEVKAVGAKTRSVNFVGESSINATPVCVVYDDEDTQTSVDKKKNRRRSAPIREKELVTMVSNISLSDEEKDSDVDDPSHEVDIEVEGDGGDQGHMEIGRSPSTLSRGERNYYDVSRKQTKDDATGLEEKENFITMTTKTILFDLEKPTESVVKTILEAPLAKPRDHADCVVPEKLSTRPRSAGRLKSAKLSKSELQSIKPVDTALPENSNGDGGFTASFTFYSPMDEERPGSRLGFVLMETDAGVKSDEEERSSSADVKEPGGVGHRPPSGRRRPLSAASKTLNRPFAVSSRQQRQSSKESVLSKRRPQSASSAVSEPPSVADVQRARAAAQALRSEREAAAKTLSSDAASRFAESRRHYASYSKSGPSGRQKRAQSATLSYKPVQIISKNPYLEDEDTEAMEECRAIQDRLACYGIDVKPQTLERALFPPTGKTLYYQLDAQLPKSYSNGLLSHPRYWLPEEHRKLKIAEKKLAVAELALWRQKKEEEHKARLAAGVKEKAPKKGKKKGKKKLRRSQSVC